MFLITVSDECTRAKHGVQMWFWILFLKLSERWGNWGRETFTCLPSHVWLLLRMGNRTRAPEIKVCYIFMEEAHIKPRSSNSLLGKQLGKIRRFTLFLALLVVVELQLKDDAMFPTASLFICVCCSLLWTPLYINSLICVCPEQGDFDLRLRHAGSYNSLNSFQEVITILLQLHCTFIISCPLKCFSELLNVFQPISYGCETWSVLVTLHKGL